jgi:hypothetical protein
VNYSVEPYKIKGNTAKASATSTGKLAKRGGLTGLILTIQSFLTNVLARYPITTTVQP